MGKKDVDPGCLSPKDLDKMIRKEYGDPKTFEKKWRGKHRQQGNTNWKTPHSLPRHFPIMIRENDSRFKK